MTSLIYKPEYNTFVIKSITVIDQVYKHVEKKYKGLNKKIIGDIIKVTSV